MAKHLCYSQACATQKNIPTLGTLLLSTSERFSEAKASPGPNLQLLSLTTGLFQEDLQFILHF